MTRPISKILFSFFMVMLPGFLMAQSNLKLGSRAGDNWFLTLSAGPTFFSGDLNINRFLPQSGDLTAAGSFSFGRKISHVFYLRGQLLFGKTAGRKETKQDGTPVELRFSSPVFDGTVGTMINFSNLIGGFNPKRVFFLYGSVGFGASYYKPTQYSTVSDVIIPNPASGGKVSAVIPLGIGGYYTIANKVNIGLEYSIRSMSSDWMDGVNEGFKMDIYSFFSLNLTLNLNKATRKGPDVVDYKKDGPIVLNLPKCDPIPPLPPKSDMGMEKLPPPPSAGVDLSKFYLFKVQIFAFGQHIYSAETIRKRYKIPLPVTREYSDGLYRFIVGSTDSIDEARNIRQQMIDAGVSDAFIVGYTRDGARTSLRDLN